MLRKGVYHYGYMDDWEKFNEATLPEKEEFYSNFNIEDISDADYAYAKRVCKDFEIKNLGEYHELLVILMMKIIFLISYYWLIHKFQGFVKFLQIILWLI